MKKSFVDLHLCPPINQPDKVKALVEKSSELGYSIVGLTFPVDISKDSIKNMQGICRDSGLDLVTRIDLTPKNAKELLNILSKVRWKFEVVAVQCTTKEVAVQAAKDRRVDLLFLNLIDLKKHFFSASEAKLAFEKSAALEVNMAPLILLDGYPRIRLMSILRRDVLIAKKIGIPIVLSSGASNPQMLRRPEDYAYLAYLIGLEMHIAKQAISDNPKSIVERNRRKLGGNYVQPGVYVIRRGKDC
ncbi:MAG: RNase P subunit p30 family protein [Candidatus Bathyarchaeia archaeon]